MSYSPRLLAKISPEPKGQQLNEISKLLESPTGWAKGLAHRRSGANGVKTKGPRRELGGGEEGKGRLRSDRQEGGGDGDPGRGVERG